MQARKHWPLRHSLLIGAATGALIGWTAQSEARVTSIAVDTRAAAYGGVAIGTAGPYETLTGRIMGELDPTDPHNTIITDITLAPKDADGKVQYIATFQLTKPVTMSLGDALLIYEVSNRGSTPIPTTASAVVPGATYLASGWQGDLLSQCTTAYPCTSLTSPYTGTNQVIQVPVAHYPGGDTITGPVYGHILNASGSTAQMVIYTSPIPYKPASLDTTQSQFTSVVSQTVTGVDTGRTLIPSQDWAWADCRTVPFPGTPDPTRICLKNGFDPNLLYEMNFTAKDPLVLGVGYAATRDIISFFHYSATDDMGVANPVAGDISKVLSIGVSQSGSFLRSTTHLGFNQDESGRKVSDGIWPQIDGRQLFMNVSFALPDVLIELNMMADEAPVWWADYPNKARGFPAAGMLDRCTATNTCPQIMESFGSLEFYDEKMAPDLIGMTADADIPLPANVYRYYLPGTTHGGGAGGFTYVADPPPASGCTQAANPNPESDTDNALQDDFIAFLLNGTPMPASVYPKLSQGQLVPATQAAEAFPSIAGYPFGGNGILPPFEYNFGPDVNYMDQSGIVTINPPIIEKVLPAYAVKVNSDGNEPVGVGSVLYHAPLGTYTGWNNIASGPLKGQQCNLAGSYFPFQETKALRLAAADPRPSLEERYGTHAGYVCTVTAAATQAVSQRFLRASAATTLISQAQASNVLTDITPTAGDQALATFLCSAGN